MKQNEMMESVTVFAARLLSKMAGKGDEYSPGGAFDNFEKAAKKRGTTPQDILLSYKLKHDVSIDDMVEDLKKDIHHPEAVWEEKIGDEIIYFLILLAMSYDRNPTKPPFPKSVEGEIEETEYTVSGLKGESL